MFSCFEDFILRVAALGLLDCRRLNALHHLRTQRNSSITLPFHVIIIHGIHHSTNIFSQVFKVFSYSFTAIIIAVIVRRGFVEHKTDLWMYIGVGDVLALACQFDISQPNCHIVVFFWWYDGGERYFLCLP